MAVNRFCEVPRCAFCGNIIAKEMHKDMDKNFFGDTFIQWNYLEHNCKSKKLNIGINPK